MKHAHDAHVTVEVKLPTADIAALINQVTDAAVVIIMAATLAQTVKILLTR